MSLSKSKRYVILAGLIVVLVSLLTSNVLFYASANNEQASFSDELLAEYEKYDEIEIPQVTLGEYKANSMLYFPSGKTYYNAQTVKLTEQGNYKIEYFYNDNGKDYFETKTFTVNNPIAGFLNKDELASFEYGYDEQTARNGLSVHLSPNNTFYYNKEIDLYNTSKDNPLVEFTFSPVQEGITDVEKIYFTFTDAEDASNSVTVVVKTRKYSLGWLYLQAKANDQLFSGKDGKTLWIEGNYGCTFQYTSQNETLLKTFNSNANNADTVVLKDLLKKQNVKFWIDTETKEVKVSYYSLMHNNGTTYNTLTIADLDDASYQTSIWEGFKSSKVFLSIRAENFVQDYVSLVVTKIGNNSLSTTGYVDESDGPQINVNYNGQSEDDLLNGEVGKSYPVFDATSNDMYCGSLPVETKVFYNYERDSGVYHTEISQSAKQIPILNGRFETAYQGSYSICYMSKDWFGNYTEKVVKIDAVNSVIDIDEIVLDGAGDLSGYVGNVTNVSSIKSVNGGVGDLQTNIQVVDQNSKQYTVCGNQIDGYYFVPQIDGVYTVIYTVTDFVNKQQTKQYQVNVTTSSNTAFSDKPSINKYFIEGQSYILPDLFGTNYSTNKSGIKATMTIIDGNGTTNYNSGDKYVFKKDNDGFATLIYDNGKNQQVFRRKVIDVIENGNTITSKYFVCSDNVSVSNVSQGVNVSISGNGKIEFINALTDINVSGEIILADYGTKFDKLSYVLTDSVDSTICVKLTIEKVGVNNYLYLNGELVTKNLPLSTNAIISYSDKSLVLNSSLKMAVKNTVYGKLFQGFTSHKVYVSVEFENVIEQASIIYKKINNQALNVKKDLMVPVIKFDQIYDNLLAKVNEEVTIVPILYCDVLSGYTFGTVSVSDSAGNFVKDINGLELKNVDATQTYKFKPTKYQNYTIEYNVVDQAGKKSTTKRIVQVLDTSAPTLTVDEMNYVQKVGYIKLPKITVQDDFTTADNITLYYVIVTPEMQMQYVDKDCLYITTVGEYKLIVTAMDEQGNSASKTIEFIVE